MRLGHCRRNVAPPHKAARENIAGPPGVNSRVIGLLGLFVARSVDFASRQAALLGSDAGFIDGDRLVRRWELKFLWFNPLWALLTIAADPRRLGARIGFTSVLHTWGSALTHHPHVHVVVPGGGLSPDGARWVSCRRGFFLPVRVLSRLFRRLFLEGLAALRGAGKLAFFGDRTALTDPDAFAAWLAPLRKAEWVVYAKPPFGGPEAVLAYPTPYTHRVAIANSRLVSANANTVAFRWKDYRIKSGDRQKVMRLATDEFIRRFLIHVLPDGFHRIRHYGLLAGAGRKTNVATIRQLLGPQPSEDPRPDGADNNADAAQTPTLREPCPDCGGPMRIIERFRRGERPTTRAPPRGAAA